MKFFLRTALVLAGILVIGVIMLTLGKPERAAKPSAENYGPSGTAAFADLLRDQGYAVRLDRRSAPVVGPDEVAIAINVKQNPIGFSDFGENAKPGNPLKDVIEDEVAEGAVALMGTMETDFQSDAGQTTEKKLLPSGADNKPIPSGPSISVSVGPSITYVDLAPGNDSRAGQNAWMNGNTAFVSAVAHKKGLVFTLSNPMFLTNRFIDKAENARFALSLLQALSPTKKVVFLEAAAGNVDDPSLLEALGVWVKYGWIQLLLFAFVVAYALGKRFGLPVYDPFVQHGQRELVEAIGFLYRRARADETALGAVLRNADRDLRKSLKLSFDAPVEQRNDQLPPSLLAALDHAARVASIKESPESQVLAAARRVEKEVADFIGSRTIIRPKRRKG